MRRRISDKIRRFLSTRFVKTEENVLVLGERGVGKDLIAQKLCLRSKRVGKPFVKIYCALVAGTSLENEIFGYEPNIPVDIQTKRRGVLFLDRIGEAPLTLQTKLFQLLQRRDFAHHWILINH